MSQGYGLLEGLYPGDQDDRIFKLKPTWELKEYVCEDNYTFDEFQTETGVKFVQ